MSTEELQKESHNYTSLSIVKEKSRIHPTTSSPKIIKQFCLPAGAIIGEGHYKLVSNEFLDKNGRLISQKDNKHNDHHRTKKKLDEIANESSIKPESVVQPEPLIKNRSEINNKLSDIKTTDAAKGPYMTIKDLKKQKGLRALVNSNDILSLPDVPPDFFLGQRKSLHINPSYINNKGISIPIDFSSLLGRTRKEKNTVSNHIKSEATDYIEPENVEKPLQLLTIKQLKKDLNLNYLANKERILATEGIPKDFFLGERRSLHVNPAYVTRDRGLNITVDFSSLKKDHERNHTRSKNDIKSTKSGSSVSYVTNKILVKDEDGLNNFLIRHKNGPALLKELTSIVSALEPFVSNNKIGETLDIENSEPYKNLSRKLQSLEGEVANYKATIATLERNNDDLLQSLKTQITLNSDAEKIMSLIYKKIEEYNHVNIICQGGELMLFSLINNEQILHYTTKDGGALNDVGPAERAKKYDAKFGKYKNAVSSIINDFLKITLPCVEPMDMGLARINYAKEVDLNSSIDDVKTYIDGLLFESELGKALISHGTDGTKANPVILRGITNKFKYHRENDFIKIMEKYSNISN